MHKIVHLIDSCTKIVTLSIEATGLTDVKTFIIVIKIWLVNYTNSFYDGVEVYIVIRKQIIFHILTRWESEVCLGSSDYVLSSHCCKDRAGYIYKI